MSGLGPVLLSWALLLAGTCVARDTGDRTFMLAGPQDARLPAAHQEDRGLDAEDLALLEGILAHHRPITSGTHPPIAVVWNVLTTELGLNAGLPPPLLARAYALTQLAVYDALVAALDERRGELPDGAVAAGAASVVLLKLFPLESLRIKEISGKHVDASPESRRAFFLGRRVGKLMLIHASEDGSARKNQGPRPRAETLWSGAVPLLPMAGSWKTWILASGAEFPPEDPYVVGSAEDLRDLQEVYDSAFKRTPAQIAAVHKWADIPPPTIWNEYLNGRLAKARWSALRSARASAYLNATMFDGFVSCWHAKYKFWTSRPYMRLAERSPKFSTVVTTPPFPSYTSGHSTISGAAAMVLGALFPEEQRLFAAEAEEAAKSRLWAGIHYAHDNEEGLRIGRLIGAKAIDRMQHGMENSRSIQARKTAVLR
jgi:hypothetical protein